MLKSVLEITAYELKSSIKFGHVIRRIMLFEEHNVRFSEEIASFFIEPRILGLAFSPLSKLISSQSIWFFPEGIQFSHSVFQ